MFKIKSWFSTPAPSQTAQQVAPHVQDDVWDMCSDKSDSRRSSISDDFILVSQDHRGLVLSRVSVSESAVAAVPSTPSPVTTTLALYFPPEHFLPKASSVASAQVSSVNPPNKFFAGPSIGLGASYGLRAWGSVFPLAATQRNPSGADK